MAHCFALAESMKRPRGSQAAPATSGSRSERLSRTRPAPARPRRVQDVSVALEAALRGDVQNSVCLRGPREAAVRIAGDTAWAAGLGGRL